ncbi:U6 snRNA phosphodiesterase 1 [Rhynchophorus ferrugineus]|uniref:U6 snRNA phosphodiesterase 1 n=1 Tax=Rhynchophorus ferrugineus TaxID=354439 RepID=UPI003FCDA386
MSGKNSLNLLKNYGNDSSSDEEVPGPRVSTKRCLKDGDNALNKRLPLPEGFRKDRIEYRDDPELHDGRIRSFAHERGNWASFVYIPITEHVSLERLVSYIKELMVDNIDVKPMSDLHISLTKTVVLRYIWINPLVKTIQNYVKCFKKFVIVLGAVKVYCNEERTRTFLGIEVKSGYDTLLKLVDNLDKCLSEFNLPPFYQDPSFHISIAWCLGDQQNILESVLPQINEKLDDLKECYPEDQWYSVVEYLLCKIGNKQFQFQLT